MRQSVSTSAGECIKRFQAAPLAPFGGGRDSECFSNRIFMLT
jgi:hypothetical protein